MATQLEKVYVEYKEGLILGLEEEASQEQLTSEMENGSILSTSRMIFSKYRQPFYLGNIDGELLKVQTPSAEFLKSLNNYTKNCIDSMVYCESRIVQIYKELEKQNFVYNPCQISTRSNEKINIPYYYFVKNCLLALASQFNTDVTTFGVGDKCLTYVKTRKQK